MCSPGHSDVSGLNVSSITSSDYLSMALLPLQELLHVSASIYHTPHLPACLFGSLCLSSRDLKTLVCEGEPASPVPLTCSPNNSKNPRRQIMLTLVHIIFPPFPWSRRTTCFSSLPSLFFYTSFQLPVCGGKNFPIIFLQFISLNSLCAQDERHLIILIMSDLIITRRKMWQSRIKRPKTSNWRGSISIGDGFKQFYQGGDFQKQRGLQSSIEYSGMKLISVTAASPYRSSSTCVWVNPASLPWLDGSSSARAVVWHPRQSTGGVMR